MSVFKIGDTILFEIIEPIDNTLMWLSQKKGVIVEDYAVGHFHLTGEIVKAKVFENNKAIKVRAKLLYHVRVVLTEKV